MNDLDADIMFRNVNESLQRIKLPRWITARQRKHILDRVTEARSSWEAEGARLRLGGSDRRERTQANASDAAPMSTDIDSRAPENRGGQSAKTAPPTPPDQPTLFVSEANGWPSSRHPGLDA